MSSNFPPSGFDPNDPYGFGQQMGQQNFYGAGAMTPQQAQQALALQANPQGSPGMPSPGNPMGAPMPPGGAGGAPGGMPQGAPSGAPAGPGQSGYLDPALVQQSLMLNMQGPQQDQMKRQLALADKLRGAAPGMAKSQSPINTPNWAGAMASVAAGYKANQLDQQAQATGTGLAQQRVNAYQAYMRKMGITDPNDPTQQPVTAADYTSADGS